MASFAYLLGGIMKKTVILALLLGLISCTKSDSRDKESLNQIPEDAVAFFHWNKSSDAYKRFSQSKWDTINADTIKDLILKTDITFEKKDAADTKDPQQEKEKFANEIITALQRFGLIGYRNAESRITSGSLFITPSNDNILDISLSIDGKDMPLSFEYLKSLTKLKGSVPTQEKAYGNFVGFNSEDGHNVAASQNRLVWSSNSTIVTDRLADKTVNSITQKSDFAKLYNNTDYNDILFSGYVDLETFLRQAASGKELKSPIAVSINDLSQRLNKSIAGGDISAVNPIKSLFLLGRMNNSPSITIKAGLKETNIAALNKALVPYIPRSDAFAIKRVPADTILFISLDGILFENVQKLLSADLAIAAAVVAPYIPGTKSLSIALRGTGDNPEVIVILEGNASDSVKAVLNSLTKFEEKDFNGIKLMSAPTSYGFEVLMTGDDNSLVLSNSVNFITEMINGNTKLYDKLSSNKTKIFEENPFITLYLNGEKASSFVSAKVFVQTSPEDSLEEETRKALEKFKKDKSNQIVPNCEMLYGISFDGSILTINSIIE